MYIRSRLRGRSRAIVVRNRVCKSTRNGREGVFSRDKENAVSEAGTDRAQIYERVSFSLRREEKERKTTARGFDAITQLGALISIFFLFFFARLVAAHQRGRLAPRGNSRRGKHDLSNQIRSARGRGIAAHSRTATTYALTTCLATLFAKSQRDFGERKRGQIGKAGPDLTYLHRCTRLSRSDACTRATPPKEHVSESV